MNERAIFTREVCDKILVSNNIYLPTQIKSKKITSRQRLNILLKLDYQRTADCLAPILFYTDKMDKKDRNAFFKEKIDNMTFFTNLILRESNVKEHLMMLARRGFISGDIFSDSDIFSACTTIFWEEFSEFFEEVISHLDLNKVVYKHTQPPEGMIEEEINVEFTLRNDIRSNVLNYYILDETRDECLSLLEG